MTTTEKEFVKQLNNVLQADISDEQRGALLSLYLWGTKVLSLSSEIKSWATRTINSYTFKEDFLRGGNVFCKEANALCRIERIGVHPKNVKATDIVEHFKKLCEEEEEKKDFQQWLDTNYREENVTWSRDNVNQPFSKTVYIHLNKTRVGYATSDAFTKAKQKDIEYYKQRKKNLRRLYDEGLISMNVCATELEHINKMLEKLGYEC